MRSWYYLAPGLQAKCCLCACAMDTCGQSHPQVVLAAEQVEINTALGPALTQHHLSISNL